MFRFLLIAVLAALASGFNAPVSLARSSKIAASRVSTVPVMAEEPSGKEVILGAAAVGGIAGVYLFHELSAGLVLAGSLAYGATLSNQFGSALKTTGSAAAKVFTKAQDLNEQYDVLPKAKGALDAVSTAAANLDSSYGISAKVDEKLKISEAVNKAVSKVDEVKSTVTEKVEDLKTKASTSEP